MNLFAKKYWYFIAFAFLLGISAQSKAQCHDSVNIRCVSVDAAGDVTLTWVVPPNVNSCGWVNYTVYVLGMNGPLTVIPVSNQTSVTIPAGSLPHSGNADSLSFYIKTLNSTPPTYNSNTVSSIYLTVYDASLHIAELSWNAVSKPLPPSSSTWYKIYREYSNNWTLIDSTQGLTYNDTIVSYCDTVSLNYQIQIADSTICTSTSNIASGGKYLLGYNPIIEIMDTVSVTSNGLVDITWKRSPRNNIKGYIVYRVYQGNNIPIDTVYGINNDSLMNWYGGDLSDSSVQYAVAALDSCGRVGGISATPNTLLLKTTPDICRQTNTLKWNQYQYLAGHNGGLGIGGYKVFCSINNGPFQLLANLGRSARSYTDSNLNVKQVRCYYVQVYDSAHPDTTASSNRVCDSIHSPSIPKNNYLRTASVILNTSSVLIAGYIDSSSGAAYYNFQRSTFPTGGFSTIAKINAPRHSDSVGYIDNTASPNVRSYYYRIITMDSCDKAIDTTNVGQTMFLTALGQSNATNLLTWNDYGTWLDGPAYYIIYRSVDGVSYTRLSPTVAYTDAGGNSFTDNIDGVITGQGTFYYYVKAVEDTNAQYPYPFIDTSLSNIADAYQPPTVFLPDAFCPTGKNKIFKPVGIFINSQGYDLAILNRWGALIFESSDPGSGWDGTYKGKLVEQGVYVYLFTYTSSRGEYYQKKGTVTLIGK